MKTLQSNTDAMTAETSVVVVKPAVDFFTTIPGASHIFMFTLGMAIPSLAIYFIGRKILPVVVESITRMKDNLHEINTELGALSESLNKTCDNIKSYSNNLRITSESATTAFQNINNSLVLTNQHIANLDTSIDVLKDAVNTSHYTIDLLKDNVLEVKFDVKQLVD